MSAISGENITKGIHHLGLTVPDVVKTSEFFINVLGYETVGGKPDYPSIFVSDGTVMLTLWQADADSESKEFNRKKNIGLHHVALKVRDKETLEALYNTLKSTEDVVIEFAPEGLGTSAFNHMMCSIPGGVRVEFIAD